MVVEGAIDRLVVDQLLEGLGVEVRDREALISRHSRLIEQGNVAGLVCAAQDDVRALAEHGRLTPVRRKKAPLIEGDLRAGLEGVTVAADVPKAIGSLGLQAALDG